MPRTIFAPRGFSAAHAAGERSPPGHDEAVVQRSLLRIRTELHHGHGRRWTEVVRAEHLEEMLREAREFGVDLELDASREEGESFEQALDVRVRTLERIEPQPARDLGEVVARM